MILNITEVLHSSDEVSGSIWSAVRYFDYTTACVSSAKQFLSDKDLRG